MISTLSKSKVLKCQAVGLLRHFRFHWGCGANPARLVSNQLCTSRSVNNLKLFQPLYSCRIVQRWLSTEGSLDKVEFESICAETLDSLTEYFEELIETIPQFKNADVTYSDGVLTVHLGKSFGTYVINRQSPNLQIWLSSPTSGPKRYDFINGTWVYKHDSTTLHALLDKEIESIAKTQVEFRKKCAYSKGKNS